MLKIIVFAVVSALSFVAVMQAGGRVGAAMVRAPWFAWPQGSGRRHRTFLVRVAARLGRRGVTLPEVSPGGGGR
ncbi:hypothetical protein [Dactylosporangium sp. NPDC051541]|uniref:hypothetical protein n=1 Tax=Dactylosporangium sp. NPDC051541 TaxID=3363977 RepID=UPI0037AAA478